MYKIEAKIKKKTINSFVKLIDKLPTLNIRQIKIIAEEVCKLIDEEVNKSAKDEFNLF